MKNLNPKLVRRFMGILIVVVPVFMILQWVTDTLVIEVLHNLSAAMLAISVGWMWGYNNALRNNRRALFNDFIAIRSQNNRARREAQMMHDPDLRN